jgi:tetratricopeptide (TPR) repeat protein
MIVSSAIIITRNRLINKSTPGCGPAWRRPSSWILIIRMHGRCSRTSTPRNNRFGYNPRPELYDSYERSLTAAHRAVEIDPQNPTAQLMLANALFDRRDLAGFRAAGERAIALNPNDPEVLVHYGMRLTFIGDWKRGVPLVTKAISLNPEHPQWYLDPLIYYHYQINEYEQALMESQKQELSGDIWDLLFRAMILAQLGRSEEAQPMIKEALRRKPDVRERFFDMARIWNLPDPQIEHMAQGLRKAGLAIAGRVVRLEEID